MRDLRFIQDRQEGGTLSETRARWKSRKCVARFGAMLHTVGSLVRKNQAVHIFTLDDHRRRARISGDVGPDLAEDSQSNLAGKVKRPYTRREREELRTSDARGYRAPRSSQM